MGILFFHSLLTTSNFTLQPKTLRVQVPNILILGIWVIILILVQVLGKYIIIVLGPVG